MRVFLTGGERRITDVSKRRFTNARRVKMDEDGPLEAATRAEWWAHCRPHSSGHQMHFDSDDEGLGGVIKHPICSAVVYVTGGVGGPTLVTNQTDCSKQLATRGWLVGPEEGRVAVFDGDMLHGRGMTHTHAHTHTRTHTHETRTAHF